MTATFADLLREHQGMVFSIALHFLRDRSVAEEVAQDVFLQLHRNFDLVEEERVIFWLRKVTANRSIDAIRKRKLRTTVALENAPEPRVHFVLPQPRLAITGDLHSRFILQQPPAHNLDAGHGREVGPSNAAHASACGPPPEKPHTAHRSNPTASLIVRTSLAQSATLRPGRGEDSP